MVRASDRPPLAASRASSGPPQAAPRPAGSRAGLVVSVARGRASVTLDGETFELPLARPLAESQQGAIAVGDEAFVELEEPRRVLAVGERRSVLSRPDPGHPRRELVLAANVDLGVVVVTPEGGPAKLALVDRFLVALQRGGIEADNSELLEAVKWPNIKELSWSVIAQTSGALPNSIPGKLEAFNTFKDAGVGIDGYDIMEAFQNPDLRAIFSPKLAPRRRINLMIERALTEGVCITPDETLDAQYGAQLCADHYNLAMIDGKHTRAETDALFRLYLLFRARVQTPAAPGPGPDALASSANGAAVTATPAGAAPPAPIPSVETPPVTQETPLV
jgi:hypothetical protein